MFNPKELPARVSVAWQHGASNWMGIVDAAIGEQMTDMFEVTEIVFHLRHPDRRGELPGPADIGLIFEFRMLMNLVKARLGSAGTRGGFGWDHIGSHGGGNSATDPQMWVWHESIRNAQALPGTAGRVGIHGGRGSDYISNASNGSTLGRTNLPGSYALRLPKRS